MSTNSHQLHSYFASVVLIEPVHIIRQQIGSRNQADSTVLYVL